MRFIILKQIKDKADKFQKSGDEDKFFREENLHRRMIFDICLQSEIFKEDIKTVFRHIAIGIFISVNLKRRSSQFMFK